MPNTATLASLTARVRQQGDLINSQFVSDAEIAGWLNVGLSELHDILVMHFEDYFENTYTFDTTGTVSDYALPVDFYKLQGVDLIEGPTRYTVRRYMNRERNRRQLTTFWSIIDFPEYRIIGSNIRFIPTPVGTRTFTIYYAPEFAQLVLGTDLVNQVIPPGWEEFAVLDATSKCLLKEESDPSGWLAKKEELRARLMVSVDDRDANEPASIIDVTRRFDGWGWSGEGGFF